LCDGLLKETLKSAEDSQMVQFTGIVRGTLMLGVRVRSGANNLGKGKYREVDGLV
jgi:hypothetical protein